MSSFPKSARLTHAGDFDRLRSPSVGSVGNRYFAIRWLADVSRGVTAGPKRRVGVIAPARLMNAVRRNLVKRIVREYFRLHAGEFPHGDCLVIARNGAAKESKERIRQALKSLLEKAAAMGAHCHGERSEPSR